jgi:subtilase family serine protease
MSVHLPARRRAGEPRPSRTWPSRSRRSRRALAAATALTCLVAPMAATQAVGVPVIPGTADRAVAMPVTSKFSAAALRVGAGKTPAARARLLAQVTPDLPLEVAAYNVKPLWKTGITGKGTAIATIVSFGDPDIQKVIDAYDEANGLPKAHVTILAPVGDPACPPGQESTCAGWKGETDLDIEMFHTIAPGAHLYVVATPVAETLGIHGFPKMMKAIDYIVKHKIVDVISMSLSATEETFKSPDQIRGLDGTFRRAKAAGVPILAASGDSGATGPKKGGGVYDHRVVGWPASDPLVTAVGGTVLHFSNGHRTEPDSLVQFSGGGLSHVYKRPRWQDGVKDITKSTMRSMPDIALEGIRGTSQSSPLFAGILGLATQLNGGKPLGFLNPVLYRMGPSGTKAGFVDVTEGDNTWQGVKGYTCKKGWDIPSSYGTVDGATFVPALVKAVHTS